MIYLDNAATTYPKPHSVYKEILKTMKKCGGNAGRGSHALARRASDAIYEMRSAAAELFSCEVENVVFTYNATHALNLAIKGFAKPQTHVLLSDLEHNSVRRPIMSLCERAGCTCSVFQTFNGNAELILRELERLVTQDTSMLVCTHVSNVCNIELPIKQIGRFCKSRGICFIVDASQSAGHRHIDLASTSADAVCMSGHKGLYGPQGTGLLITSSQRPIETVFEGGSGMDSLSIYMPEVLPERLEAGTMSAPLAKGLAEGIKWVTKIGVDLIHRHETELSLLLTDYLSDIKGVNVYASPDEHFGGTVLVNLDGYTPSELGEELDRLGICIRSGLHCAPLAHRTLGTGENGAVRISFGYFNDVMDVRRLVENIYLLSKN